MFRITQDPSSGSYFQYLTTITDNGSIVQAFVTFVASVMAVYAAITLATNATKACTIEPLSVILVKY
jgi:hypothetical protein